MTFADPDLADWLNSRFVLAWVNVAPDRGEESGEDQPRYAPEEIAAYPEGGGGENIRTYFCSPEGDVRHTITGFWRPQAFRLEAERALDYCSSKPGRAAARLKLLEDAEILEKAHPEEKGKPIRDSGILRRCAALRLLGEIYQQTEPLIGKPVAPILDQVIQEKARVKEFV